MGRLRTICVVVLMSLSAPICRADPVSPEDAQKKLVEKQKLRDAERSQTIAISAGELQDLRTELAALRSEVARLRAQGGGKAGAGAGGAAAGIAKRFESIEIGMTRKEVMAFVHQHSKEFAITGITASKPGNAVTGIQTVRRTGAEGDKLNGAVEQIESSRLAPKNETINIDKFTAVKVAVGERPSFGVTYTEYEWQYKKSGSIIVTLEDDAVTGVTARTD